MLAERAAARYVPGVNESAEPQLGVATQLSPGSLRFYSPQRAALRLPRHANLSILRPVRSLCPLTESRRLFVDRATPACTACYRRGESDLGALPCLLRGPSGLQLPVQGRSRKSTGIPSQTGRVVAQPPSHTSTVRPASLEQAGQSRCLAARCARRSAFRNRFAGLTTRSSPTEQRRMN